MTRMLMIVVSSFVMVSMSSEFLYASSVKTEGDGMLVTLDHLAGGPQVSQETGAGICVSSNTTKAAGGTELPEVLRGSAPIPAASPLGCSNWGACSIECWVSCFYNYECPPVDGQPQFCLCSGMCP